MNRTYRYPLRPTKAQEAVLESWRVACQQLYNGALQERRDAWKRCGVSRTLYDQTKGLTELRQSDAEWASIPVLVARSALRRVDLAFKAFFRRVKAGEKPGFPRFRSRDRYDSFGLGRVLPSDGRLRVPKLGLVRFHEYRPLKGKVLSVEVRRSAGKWFVCFSCDLGEAPAKKPVATAIGIDLGLAHFATLSNGEAVASPKFFRQSERVLARAQRQLSRKRRGSTRRLHAKSRVALVYQQIGNRRKDFARKLACSLYQRFDLVAHEDLQIRRMVHGNLSKSIHDASWGLFLNALALKAESAGRWCVAVDPRGTSQRCSNCGTVVPKTLSQREHHCGCGTRLDRDHNAALNVLALAAVPGAPGKLTLVDSDSAGRNEKPI